MIRQWCLEIPEIVNISVNTPYPGTETWLTESRRVTSRDYRLFDIQHAVLPTTAAGRVLRRAGPHAAGAQSQAPGLDRREGAGRHPGGQPARGQTNTLKMLWKFNSVYNPRLQSADHRRPVRYEMAPPPAPKDVIDPRSIYVHPAKGRRGRVIDDATETFVDQTRMKADAAT